MERRTFLRTAALSALAVTSLSELSFGAETNRFRLRPETGRPPRRDGKKKIPIAVQVYSVRKAAEKDLAAVLAGIAKLGYEGVEFAGYYGKEAKDIRKMLDDNGLKCSGTHTGIGALRGDNFEKTAELHKTLGTKYIIVPGGIDKELHDVEKNKAIAEEFNKLAEKAKTFDLYVGYHAHGGDAKLIDGIPAWERFFDATSQDVAMEMDLGNYQMGGGDPYKMIEKFKGRSKVVHLKEAGKDDPVIGDGEVDWKRAFNLLETVGGVEWYVVEDERWPDNLDRIEKCLEKKKKMGK
jgi:sugar phosphate isomerase/epimerase